MHRQTLLTSAALSPNRHFGTDPSATTAFPFIQVDGRTRLFYRDWVPLAQTGNQEGRTVLFVTGWAVNADMWQYQMCHLNRLGMRTVAFDRRSHGRSTDPGCGYDFDTFADDLAAVIETLDLHAVMLVGHSMGCGEIVRYLTRHGSARISNLVLISPTLPFVLKTDDNPTGVDRLVLENVRTQLATDFPGWLHDNAKPFYTQSTEQGMIDWTIDMCQQASLQALIEINQAVTDTDFRAELRGIKVPTLIIHGDRDVSAPVDFTARPTADLIPGAQLEIYQEGPHGLFITHMERLNRDLFAQAHAHR